MVLSLTERLRGAADRCCKDEDEDEEEGVSEFLELLESPLRDEELKRNSHSLWLLQCEEALQQAGEMVDPSSVDPSGLVLCEKLGLELPKVAVKFVSLSQACQDHCLTIIEALAENCSPREMFAAFMEALNMYTAPQTLICCIPLLQGLSLVFSRLQRRHAQFFQEASSGLLALVRLATVEEEEEEEEEEENVVPLEQIRAAIVENIVQLAQVVREACDAVAVADFQQRLRLFVLQTLGIAGEQFARPGLEVPVPVMELVELLPGCGPPVCLLFTKNHIELLIEMPSDDVDAADLLNLKNQKRDEALKGAALAGYWLLSNEATVNSIREELKVTGRKGVMTALSVATSLLRGRSSSRPLSSVPAAGLTLVDTVLDMAPSLALPGDEDDVEGDGYMALTLASLPPLQNLQNVVVYAPSIEMRRQGYAAIKRVIQDVIPESARLQCLQMLISNCPFPSLVSLHLICIKDEVAKAWPQPSGDVQHVTSPFVSEAVIEVIGSVLRPSTGAPPELPAQIDSVQSALNLYRFLLIRESSGKTNYTGVLAKECLSKARMHWLLPLRELVEGVTLGLVMEDNEVSADMTLAIDSLQSVLYRCIELNEEALARL